MPKQSVFITRLISDAGVAKLVEAGLAVSLNSLARNLTPEELREIVGRHDAIICQLSDRIDETILQAAAPRCRVFATCAVGIDNIDLVAAKRLGIVIANTPDVLTEATADLAWALLLSTARRLGEAERVLRAGGWRGWSMLDLLGVDICGKTLGIVGAGRIGTAVARRAAGFKMQVLYYGARRSAAIEEMGARLVSLADLLSLSDFVSLHTPLLPSTRNLIDAKAIARMKPRAILINTARGAVIDQDALIAALRSGRIAGAGLDVYRDEPKVSPELMALENVVLSPHIGSATIETRSRMAEIAAENVIAVLNGRPPLTPV